MISGALSHFRGSRVPPAMRILSTAVMISAALAATGCGRKNNDKLSEADVAASQGESAKPDGADRRCASARSSDAVKAQLFARAAEIRGGFADNYARIAGFALLQLDGAAPVSPVGAGEAVDCRAHAVLRLPPGLHASGGRTQVGGDINYTVAPGASGIVTLGAAEAVTEPLATLSQGRTAATPTMPVSPSSTPGRTPPEAPARPLDPLAPAPVAPPPPASATSPSYSCARARTPSERAVCASPGLAALDRTMASRYVDALRTADPAAAQLLRRTRDPFLGYRERCGDDASCIERVYRGRIREIDDILRGRWQGSR